MQTKQQGRCVKKTGQQPMLIQKMLKLSLRKKMCQPQCCGTLRCDSACWLRLLAMRFVCCTLALEYLFCISLLVALRLGHPPEVPAAQPDAEEIELEEAHGGQRRLLSFAQLPEADKVEQLPDMIEESDKFEQQLSEAIEINCVSSRAPLGQRFAKELKKGTVNAKEYAKARGWREKEAFRVQWAKTCLQELKQHKSHKTQMSEFDKTTGEYINMAVLMERQGYLVDPQGAAEKAKLYAQKCKLLGGHWTLYNKLTETEEYFFLKKQHMSVMEESWTLREEATSAASHDNGSNAEVTTTKKTEDKASDVTSQERELTTPKTKPSAKAKEGSSRASTTPKAKSKSKVLNSTDESLRKAKVLRASYHSIVSQVRALEEQVTSPGNPWNWADSPHNFGRCKQAYVELMEKLTDTDKMVLITDLQKMKADKGEQSVTAVCNSFLNIEQYVKQLDREQQRLKKMHAASM